MDSPADAYSFIAHQYDRLLGPVLDGLRREGFELCPPVPGWRVLGDYHPGPLRFPTGHLARPFILAAERLAGRDHYRNHLRFLAAGGIPAIAPAHGFSVDRARVRRGGTFGVYVLALTAP